MRRAAVKRASIGRMAIGRVAATCASTMFLLVPVGVGVASAGGGDGGGDEAPGGTAVAAPVADAGATTLPLLGVQLTVDVATAPDGSLASVAVNPAQGLTATKLRANTVAFVNEDGTAKVRVGSRHGGQHVDVKAGSLADIVGPGTWSGDVFGTGTSTTVSFEIAAKADGSPDIVGVTTTDPSATVGDVQRDSSPRAQRARAVVRFASGAQARLLWITASVWTAGDETRAASSVGLSDLEGVTLPADQVVGAHVWNGRLCDGTAVQVNYTVAADGSIVAGAIDPVTATAKVDGNSLRVRFSDHERVRIRVAGKHDGLRVSVDPKLRCSYADPTVNTPVDPSATDDHHDRGRDGDGGRDGRKHDGDSSGRRG